MSEQIDCGDGWRLLREYDVVLDGDEFLNFGEWQPVFKMMIGEETRSYQVRRRISSKPEWTVIQNATITCDLSNTVTRIINGECSLLLKSPKEARQLADWLNRFADWREANE